MPLHHHTRLTLLLAALLALLGCSGSDLNASATGLVSGLSCGWHSGGELTMPADPVGGVCWLELDPDAVVTPDWVDGPCDVNDWQLARAAPGQTVNSWWPTLATSDRPIRFTAEPGENCE